MIETVGLVKIEHLFLSSLAGWFCLRVAVTFVIPDTKKRRKKSEKSMGVSWIFFLISTQSQEIWEEICIGIVASLIAEQPI